MRRQLGFALIVGAAALWSLAATPSREAGKILWSTPLGTYYSDSSPAIAPDGTIYLGAWSGKLFAIRPDGARKWAFETGVEIKSSPAIAVDGTVYFGSRDRHFYAVNQQGKLKWSFGTRGWVDSSPAVATNGVVYFGSWDRTFYALAPDGRKLWEFVTGGPVASSPAIGSDGTIYFGSDDKQFYALSPDGRKKWAFETGGEIISSPAIGPDGTIFFTSVDGKLYALRPDGTAKWQLWTGGVSEASPVIDPDGAIYCAVNQDLCCVTPDGKKKWGMKICQYSPTDSSPAITAGNALCVFCGDGVLIGYTLTGAWQWSIWLGGGSRSSPAITPNGTIHVGICSAKFNAISGTNTLAKSSWPMFRRNLRHTGNVADEQ